MPVIIRYEGLISGTTIATSVDGVSAANLVNIVSSNGQRVLCLEVIP